MVIRLIASLGLAAQLTACVTGGFGSQDYTKELHVHQTNGQDVLTELNRDQWIDIRKTSNSAHMKLYSALGTKEWDVAISDARSYLKDHPKDMVALKVLSIGLAMKQNYSLAAYYGRLLEKYYPGQVDTNNIQGLAILSQPGATYSDFNKAMVMFERSFEANSRNIASGLNLGQLHLSLGNGQSSQEVFKLVAERCGNCTAALMGYGVAASRSRDFKTAKEAFQAVLDKEPGHLKAKYYSAVVESIGFGKPKAAVEILAEVLDDRSNNYMDIKRKANFLMRRLEAQIHAVKQQKLSPLDEGLSDEVEMALESKEQGTSNPSDEGSLNLDFGDSEDLLPVSDGL